MKKFLLATLLSTVCVSAQLRNSGIPERDRQVTSTQAEQIFKALRAVSFEAKEIVYPIYSGRAKLAYGISLGDGILLTKASEVLERPGLFTATREGVSLPAKIKGTYPGEDLAILEVSGLEEKGVKAAEWANAESLDEGAILAAIRPDGEAQAMGVLSVRERSLRSEDQGFLGIRMDPRQSGLGVRVQSVEAGSAADQAGILAGDVITMIDGEELRGFYELSTRLRRMKSGDQPEIQLRRAQESLKVTPILKGRQIDLNESPRLRRMDRMSGSQSRVRGEFGSVIQSDMELESSDVGLPVVDLEGRVMGMVIARAGRISTLILPGEDLAELLKTEAIPYEPSARTLRRAAGVERAQSQAANRRERVMRELDKMQQMMENLRRQIERE